MKCSQLKTDDSECFSHAMIGSSFCYSHNPEIPAEDKRRARSEGGKANKVMVQEALPAMEIKDVRDVVTLLADTTNRVRSGELDLKVANTLGFLAGHLIKALEITELEERVEVIERTITERSARLR